MPENKPNNSGLEISDGIGFQRYKTVVTPSKKLSEAVLKEIQKPAIRCQRCSCFAFVFTKSLFNVQNVLKTNLKEKLKLASRQSFPLYFEFFI